MGKEKVQRELMSVFDYGYTKESSTSGRKSKSISLELLSVSPDLPKVRQDNKVPKGGQKPALV